MAQAIESARPPREFGLIPAIGLSVGVHVVLALLMVLLADLVPPDIPPPREEPVLQFTFDRGPERLDPTEPPRGTVPDPTPEAPQSPPAPVAQPTPAGVSVPPSPASVPQPAVPPPQPAAPPAEQPDTRPDEIAPEKRTAEPEDDRPGLSAPDRPDAAVTDGAAPPRTSTPERSLNRALREYQAALERAKASQPAESQSGTKQNVFVPDMSRLPVQGTPYGILEFSSRDYDWSDYYRQIYWEILKAWYRRMYATTEDFEKWAHENNQWMLRHQSRISFVIHRSGNVSDIVLDTGSGCDPLDQSAMDGLSEVILVPLPADFPRESEQVRATFIATGEIATMRQYFGYLKRINFF